MKAKFNFKKITDQVIKKAPGLVAGAVASKFVGKGIDYILKDKATPKITAGLTIVAGAVLPGLIGSGSKKDDFMSYMCDGILTQGCLKLLTAFNIPVVGAYDGSDDVSGPGVDDYEIPEDDADVRGYGEPAGSNTM